jgi:hypothetical protein
MNSPTPSHSHSPTSSPILHLADLEPARLTLSPPEFRAHLRHYLLEHPHVTLRRVGDSLGVSRQKVGWMAGRLWRPSCCLPGPRSAPERAKAASCLTELHTRVAAGESASAVAKELGFSLSIAVALGFRTKEVRPPHGTWERARGGGRGGSGSESPRPPCNCWRCRRVAGVSVPRGTRTTPTQKEQVIDWLAWTDPDDGKNLSQAVIGALVGVGQMAVSRVSQAAGPGSDAAVGGTE